MGIFATMFKDVRIGDFRYAFYIVTGHIFKTEIMKELHEQFRPFAAELGRSGIVIMAHETGEHRNAYEEVKAKDWPEDVSKNINKTIDPFMLVINKDFEAFDPNHHSWGIIWFSDFLEKPERIYMTLGQLAHMTRYGEDIFEHLRSIAKKRKFRRWTKYFDFKPGIFGISIDMKAILLDIV